MKLIAGLGNPGPKYETTRHNAGFLAIDRMVDRWSARGPEGDSEGDLWEATVGGEKVLLVKPLTFMNNSGRCIAPLFKFYKLKPEDLIVIHDEIDLKPLQLRIKTGGGAGGHNGIRSIDAHLGAGLLNYHRIRVGVGKPLKGQPGPQVVDYVLQQFTDEELEALDPVLDDVAKAAELLVAGDVRKAMNEFNKDRTPVEKPVRKE